MFSRYSTSQASNCYYAYSYDNRKRKFGQINNNNSNGGPLNAYNMSKTSSHHLRHIHSTVIMDDWLARTRSILSPSFLSRVKFWLEKSLSNFERKNKSFKGLKKSQINYLRKIKN